MKRLFPLFGVCLLAAACSAAAVSTPAPSPSPTPRPTAAASGYAVATEPNHLILSIATGGGFIAPSSLLTEIPSFALFGDGTIVVPGPVVQVDPAPLLPNLAVERVTPAEIQKIVAAADAAGLLGPDASYDIVGVADAGTPTFTTVVNGRAHRVSAYALSPSGDADQPGQPGRPGAGGLATPDPAISAARAKLSSFWAQMSDLSTFLGRPVSDTAKYVPAGIDVFLTDAGPADPSQPVAQVAWPLAADPSKVGRPTAVDGTVCVALTGADLTGFTAAAGASNGATVWTYGSARYTIGVRPLYPNETGCSGGAL